MTRQSIMDWVKLVACPTCNVPANEVCVSLDERRAPQVNVPHAARKKLAIEQGHDPWKRNRDAFAAQQVRAKAVLDANEAEVLALADKLKFAYALAGDKVLIHVARFMIKHNYSIHDPDED